MFLKWSPHTCTWSRSSWCQIGKIDPPPSLINIRDLKPHLEHSSHTFLLSPTLIGSYRLQGSLFTPHLWRFDWVFMFFVLTKLYPALTSVNWGSFDFIWLQFWWDSICFSGPHLLAHISRISGQVDLRWLQG